MNFKNPFNNNNQNNTNSNQNIDNQYDYRANNFYQSNKLRNDNINNKDFEIIYQEYLSKIKPLNCSSNYISCSSEIFPSNEETCSQLGIPITLSLSPIISSQMEGEIPLINYGLNEIPRCKNKDCKIFLNPFVKFIENGEKWICNFSNDMS